MRINIQLYWIHSWCTLVSYFKFDGAEKLHIS